MQLMIALLVFVLVLDDQIGTKIFSAPLVACTLIGAALGNITLGMQIGATSQILFTMCDSSYMSASIFSMITTVLGVQLANSSIVSTASVYVIFIAYIFEGCVRLVNTLFINPARNQAAKAHISITSILVPLLIRGVAAFALTYYVYGNASTIDSLLTSIYTDYDWVGNWVIISSRLMMCLGLAIALRNLSVKDHYGALLAGFAAASIVTSGYPAVLFLCGLIAFGIGAYDFKRNRTNETTTTTNSVKKGSAEKWW